MYGGDENIEFESEKFKKLRKFEKSIISWLSYKYFDTPDGEDLPKKAFYLTKMVGGLGLFYNAYETIALSFVPTWTHAFVQIMKKSLPYYFAGMMYATTTHISTIVRNKDDGLNHFFGGLSTGIPIFYLARSPAYGWGFGLLAGVAGLSIRSWKLEDPNIGKYNIGALIAEKAQNNLGYQFGKDVDFRLIFEQKPVTLVRGTHQQYHEPLFYSQTPPPLSSLPT